MQETLGDRIKRLRMLRNLTQEDLAARVGIGVNNLVGMESGRIRLFGPYLEPLAEVLCVSTEYLQSGREGPQDEIAEFASANFANPDQRERFEKFVRETSFRTNNLNQQELRFLLEQFLTLPR